MRDGPSGPRRARWLELPHPSRLADDHPRRVEVLARHDRACAASLSSYVDPGTGYTVLTAAYLDDRGYCCGNGCRHCPWEGAAEDPEPVD
ncbi:hypothetical protein BH10ACT1_BH10ACT1_36240 [soil metagenome]